MAIRLQSKPNVIPPGGDYPYGRIKDNPGDGSGTPVNEQVYGDFHQFFAKMLAIAGITGNDLPDNQTNSFQYIAALNAIIAAAVSTESSARFTADATLQTNITNEASTRASADIAEATARGNADTALQASKADVAQSPWVNLTLANGWAVATNVPQWRQDTMGRIWFRGALDGSAATSDNVTATSIVPNAGYNVQLPTVRVHVTSLILEPMIVSVQTSGQVISRDHANSLIVTLDGLSYSA